MNLTTRRLAYCIFGLAVATCCQAAVAQEKPADAQQTQWAGTLLAPRAFRIAAERVAPSIVTIESFGGVSVAQGKIGGIRKQGEGNTTGLVISPDGFIVTSTFNFITKPPVITVITSDGKRHYAEIMGRDHTRKICLLKIKDVTDLVVPEFVPVEEVQVGQWAISVGIGYGDKNSAISAGIISAKHRISRRAIQTDANISPANYGGPLVDIQGRVLGICSPLSPNSQGLAAGVEWYDSGIGFAIPLAEAEQVLAKLKTGQDIKPARLGIRAKAGKETDAGILVQKVEPKSPAGNAGVKSGDLIVQLNGADTKNLAELRTQLQKFTEGDSTSITVKRKDEELELEITFTATEEKKSRKGSAKADKKEAKSKPAEGEKAEDEEDDEAQDGSAEDDGGKDDGGKDNGDENKQEDQPAGEVQNAGDEDTETPETE